MEDSEDCDKIIYDEVYEYLLAGTYPEKAEKPDKAVIRKRAKKFEIDDGTLAYKDVKGGTPILRQVITDTKMKRQILEACHDNRVGGCHFGRDKTVDKVISRFYWKGINKDTEKWVNCCEVCQRSRRKFDKPAAALHPIPVSAVWNKIGIDLIELPLSARGNRYCITLIDYYSKWAEAEPIPTKEAKNVAEFLYKMIMRHGCPQEIISDQGREFCNQIMDRLEAMTGFKHRVTSAYHPQSNGLDERLNQTLKTSLQKLVNDHRDDWDNLVDNVLFAYRTSRQDSTKFTPFYIMYNRVARLPIDVCISGGSKATDDATSVDDQVVKLISMREKIHIQVTQNIHKAQEKQKQQYDRKHNTGSTLKVGDEVLTKNSKNEGRKGGKLDPQFFGPYTIEEDLGKGRWRLKGDNGMVLKKSYNTQNLKLWMAPNDVGDIASATTPIVSFTSTDDTLASASVCVPSKQDCCDGKEPTCAVSLTSAPSEENAGNTSGDGANCLPSTYDPSCLESQVVDENLLRLWRTGANSRCLRAEEEADENHDYLAESVQSPDEMPVSKDVSVAVWQDYREYMQLPKLKEAGNFVIMTFGQMNEYDEFKEKECESEYSYLKNVELLQHFMTSNAKEPCIVHKFGMRYLRFHCDEMDELVDWVWEKRKGDIGEIVPVIRSQDHQRKKPHPRDFQEPLLKRQRKNPHGRSCWVKSLQLREMEKTILEEDGLLTDRHMYAGQLLLRRQFPKLQGLQDTLFSQLTENFKPINSKAVQILFSGHEHWICTSYTQADGVYVYDSLPEKDLQFDVQNQIARLYGGVAEEDMLTITRCSVQKQSGANDCGLYALANAFHFASGDDVQILNFRQDEMRRHVVKCFNEEKLIPFPQTMQAVNKTTCSFICLQLFCCQMPECYDTNMVCCDLCDSWFHFKCVGIQCNCTKSSCNCSPSIWTCSSCAKK